MTSLEDHGFTLIKQGAEAKLFSGTYLGKPTIVKERFQKSYRHPELDKLLTKERMKAEARSIVRCQTLGIRTPLLYLVDFERHCIFMEHLQNSITVKEFIFKLTEKRQDDDQNHINDNLLKSVANRIGSNLGIMHKYNIIHGDLTTSNMLLIPLQEGTVSELGYDVSDMIFIDFGLSRVDSSAEDKAVDLYVLERALTSTHSICPHLFQLILDAYKETNYSQFLEVLNKCESVRARGRKRTMVG